MGLAVLSALRWARRASFSRCFTCRAFSRSRFAIVVLPARAMVPSFYPLSVKGERTIDPLCSGRSTGLTSRSGSFMGTRRGLL